MSCKSCLYAANVTSQTIGVNGTVNFGSVIRRFGQNCNMSGGNVAVSGTGYYEATVNLTFEGTAASTATITLYKDGVAIPGANVTVTTADGSQYAAVIPAVIREMCSCEGSTISAVVTGSSITISNASIVVKKV